MDGKIVDYMDLIARTSEEERARKDEKAVLPEPAGNGSWIIWLFRRSGRKNAVGWIISRW